jgi:hypothetical protein
MKDAERHKDTPLVIVEWRTALSRRFAHSPRNVSGVMALAARVVAACRGGVSWRRVVAARVVAARVVAARAVAARGVAACRGARVTENARDGRRRADKKRRIQLAQRANWIRPFFLQTYSGCS